MNKIRIILLLCFVCILVFVGYKYYDTQVAARQEYLYKLEIKSLGLQLYHFHDVHDRLPSGLDELGWSTERNPSLAKQILDGDFIVAWNARLDGHHEDTYLPLDRFIMGYEATVSESGGWVLDAEGGVEQLPPEEFSEMLTLPVITDSQSQEKFTAATSEQANSKEVHIILDESEVTTIEADGTAEELELLDDLDPLTKDLKLLPLPKKAEREVE